METSNAAVEEANQSEEEPESNRIIWVWSLMS